VQPKTIPPRHKWDQEALSGKRPWKSKWQVKKELKELEEHLERVAAPIAADTIGGNSEGLEGKRSGQPVRLNTRRQRPLDLCQKNAD